MCIFYRTPDRLCDSQDHYQLFTQLSYLRFFSNESLYLKITIWGSAMLHLEFLKSLEDDSMLYFKNLNEFESFYHDFNLYSDWKILTGTPNDRGRKIANRPYSQRLIKAFEKKSMFRRRLSIGELTSFMDNFYFMSRLFKTLKGKLPLDTLNEIQIFCEYKIRMSKNRRVDYILLHNEKMLLIEFRLSNDFPNTSNVWQKKELELIIYKELISNYAPKQMKVIVYAFVGMPEYEGNTNIEKHQKYNLDNLEHLSEYISLYLI